MTIRSSVAPLVAAAMVTAVAGCGNRPQAAESPPEPVVAVVPHIKPDLGPPPTPAAPPADAPKTEVTATPARPTTPPPEPQAQPQPQPQPAPAAAVPFRLPDDAGGKKLAAVLAPSAPPGPPLPGATGPRPRASAVDRGEAPLPKVTAVIPALPLPAAAPPKPTPPPERVPLDLGRSAVLDPDLTRLPDPPLIRGAPLPAPSAADLPPLATPLPSRAPVTDPTAELSAARVVMTRLPLPFNPGWFVRFGIPDPFELAAHVRGKTGAVGELGTAPVSVPPARPQ